MYNVHNCSTIYVDFINGNDKIYSGLSPIPDKYGEGPYKTLNHALKILADQRKTAVLRPMRICLVSDYYISAPIVIDSNMTDLTIESYGSRKRIIGGVAIKGWEWGSFNGKACLVATLPTIDGDKRYDFTDLFVNGKRARTPRFPKEGTLTAVDTEEQKRSYNFELIGHSKWFIPRKEDIEGIDGIEDATVNYYHFWIDEHSPIERYDRESGRIYMRYPSRFTLSALHEQKAWSAMYYYLSGIPNAFGERGDWYLDRQAGRVYYIPENERETPDTLEAFYPVSDGIFKISSSDVRIRNLDLTVTKCDYESNRVEDKSKGLLVDDDGSYGSDGQSVSCGRGAIEIEYSKRITLTDCYIHSLGIYAVSVGVGCNRIRIENNVIEDTAAGGVRIYGGGAAAPMEYATSDIFVINNEIAYFGKRYEAGCGILLCHAHDNVLEGNHIHHGGYSGISAGWVWGYADSVTYGNIIRRNHIHHLGMGNLSDMGGIYLLGKQRGTVVAENRIHHVICKNYGAWGIYLDEGSSYVTVENNLVYATGEECFDLHYGSHNVVRNNIFAATLGHYPIRNSKNELHEEVLFENNLIVSYGSPIFNTECGVNTLAATRNFYYDMKGGEPVMIRTVDGENITLREWQSIYRQDEGSLVVNPNFADESSFDFTPAGDCSIYSAGFSPLPLWLTKGE